MDSIRYEVRKRTPYNTTHGSPFTAVVDFAEADQEHQVSLCVCLCPFLPSHLLLCPFSLLSLARCDSFSFFTLSSRAEALSFMRSELQLLCIEAHRRRKEVRNAKHPRKPCLFFVLGTGKLSGTSVEWCAEKTAEMACGVMYC